MTKLLVTLGGVLLIAFIYWFFFGKKEEIVKASENLKIIVKGGYKPATIKIKKGQEAKLTFLRKDSNSCLEEVIFPDFKIRQYLPMDKEVKISLSPQKAGVYNFHCGMNMFYGKLIVE